MRVFTRIVVLTGLLLLLFVTYRASVSGFGLARLVDTRIREAARTDNGGLRYFSGRSIRGGGPRYGK
jgi:hypothetical protein